MTPISRIRHGTGLVREGDRKEASSIAKACACLKEAGFDPDHSSTGLLLIATPVQASSLAFDLTVMRLRPGPLRTVRVPLLRTNPLELRLRIRQEVALSDPEEGHDRAA